MYMLDTNSVSYLVKAHPRLMRKIHQIPVKALCISAITGGELLFGLARKPEATKLHAVAHAFLRHVEVLPWTQATMHCYGTLRARLQGVGTSLGPLDMLIAAHALQTQSVLVTNDAAFLRVGDLVVEDWTKSGEHTTKPSLKPGGF